MDERPSRAKAANFVTGTPFPPTRRVLEEISHNRIDAKTPSGRVTTPGRYIRIGGGTSISATPTSNFSSVKRRKIDHSLENADSFSVKPDSVCHIFDTEPPISSNFPSATCENIALQKNVPLETDVDEKAKLHTVDENFSTTESSKQQLPTPLPAIAYKSSNYFTGDLVKACCVM